MLIVPCYNEAKRFRSEYFIELLKVCDIHILFVNDGSSDDTLSVLEKFTSTHHKSTVIDLAQNFGKAEAVRIGMLAGFGKGAHVVGFVDADGAFSVSDIQRVFHLLEDESDPIINGIIASRVKLRGRNIDRTLARHFLGRVVSTLIGFKYPNSPYDSQAGLKVFRTSPILFDSLASPFRTRWFVDLELLVRLDSRNFGLIWEEPLMSWTEIPGGNINLRQFFVIAKEILLIVSGRIA